MTPKEYRAFAKALKKVDIIDVRECADPDLEPNSIKRDIANTELERRRQAIDSTNNRPIIARSFFLILIAILMASVAIWWFF